MLCCLIALFKETRRIVSAELQQITYEEWFPLIVGRRIMKRYKLAPRRHMYDDTVDAMVSNVFSSAAFRFGHTLVKDYVKVGMGCLVDIGIVMILQ